MSYMQMAPTLGERVECPQRLVVVGGPGTSAPGYPGMTVDDFDLELISRHVIK